MIKIYAIAGYARSGKDSLYKGFEKAFREEGVTCERFAFADSLKDALDPFSKKHLGISSWADGGKDKIVLRPLMVGFGESMRNKDPKHWIKDLSKKIKESNCKVACVTDVRYLNEFEGLEDEFGEGAVCWIWIDNEDSFPANPEEDRSFSNMLKNSKKDFDYILKWATMFDDELLLKTATLHAKQIIEKHEGRN